MQFFCREISSRKENRRSPAEFFSRQWGIETAIHNLPVTQRFSHDVTSCQSTPASINDEGMNHHQHWFESSKSFSHELRFRGLRSHSSTKIACFSIGDSHLVRIFVFPNKHRTVRTCFSNISVSAPANKSDVAL